MKGQAPATAPLYLPIKSRCTMESPAATAIEALQLPIISEFSDPGLSLPRSARLFIDWLIVMHL